MPEIILTLWNAWEETSPFARERQIGIVGSLRQIPESIPCRMKGLQIVRCLLVGIAMRQRRELELATIAARDQKDPLASLGDAVTRCVKNRPNRRVVGLYRPVDVAKPSKE